MRLPRRDFLKALLALGGGAAAGGLLPGCAASKEGGGGAAEPPPGTLPDRVLGRTGVSLPILGLGGAHLGRARDAAAARALVDAALEEGIRFLDTAESYQDGGSETWLGAALEGRRDRVFLMTKTHEPKTRSAESAKRHLEGSLTRLATDRLDLWQLHSIKSAEDVDRAFAPGGAMEFIRRAKEQGVVRFVGVTGHADPAAHLRAIEWFDRGVAFDAMQLPLNPMDWHQSSFQRLVLPELVKRGIGVIAMKTSAAGTLVDRKLCEPAECLGYVWSLPVHLAVVGMESPRLVRENARTARGFQPWPPERMDALRARLAPRASLSLERYKAAPGG